MLAKRRRMHQTWINIRSRCYAPKDTASKYYGGRGIKICDRWLDPTKVRTGARGAPPSQGFLNFLEDMGSTWFEGATIDRIDNDGDYTPKNCRWLTQSDNSKRMIAQHGNPMKDIEVAKRVGIARQKRRIYYGGLTR